MSEKKVVLIGASYAKGWEITDIKGIDLVNKGVGGEESSQMLARFDRDVIGLNPSAVVIWGFINDFFRSDIKDWDQTARQTRKNLLEMVNIAEQSDIIPILATEVTITIPDEWSEIAMDTIGRLLGKKSYQDRINLRVQEANEWIRELGTERNFIVLDFEQVLADNQGRRARKYATQDGSHLSQQAYDTLSTYISGIDLHLE